MSSLKAELIALRNELEPALSEEVRTRLQRVTQRLIDNNMAAEAAGAGQPFPQFALPNAGGNAVDSEDFLARGPLVISFYRGGWCPYCNLQLRAFQAALPRIRELGADFVAISPQLPDEALSMAAKANLSFEVLSDAGNSLASHLGLTFELPDSVVDIYRSMGIDLDRINGSATWSLPIPATYVVDTNSVIVDAFVHADYRVRREPADVIAVLRGLRI